VLERQQRYRLCFPAERLLVTFRAVSVELFETLYRGCVSLVFFTETFL